MALNLTLTLTLILPLVLTVALTMALAWALDLAPNLALSVSLRLELGLTVALNLARAQTVALDLAIGTRRALVQGNRKRGLREARERRREAYEGVLTKASKIDQRDGIRQTPRPRIGLFRTLN